MLPTRTKSIIIGIAGGLVLFAGYVAISTDPDEIVARSIVPPISPERPDNSPFSAGHHRDLARLHDIGRRGRWDAADAAWIEDIIGPAWPDVPRDPGDPIQTEQLDLFTTACAILNGRIQNDLPVPEGTIGVYRRTVVGLLEHPRAFWRRKGTTAAGNGRMLDDPVIGTLMRDIAVNDPNRVVRRSASLKLNQADGIESPADGGCASCPKGGTP